MVLHSTESVDWLWYFHWSQKRKHDGEEEFNDVHKHKRSKVELNNFEFICSFIFGTLANFKVVFEQLPSSVFLGEISLRKHFCKKDVWINVVPFFFFKLKLRIFWFEYFYFFQKVTQNIFVGNFYEELNQTSIQKVSSLLFWTSYIGDLALILLSLSFLTLPYSHAEILQHKSSKIDDIGAIKVASWNMCVVISFVLSSDFAIENLEGSFT